MIQRIQTVYLFLGVTLLAATPFVSDAHSQPAASLPWFLPAAGAVLGAAALAGLVAIFLYGNRKRQKMVILLSQLLIVVFVALALLGRNLAPAPVGAEAMGPVAVWSLFALPGAAYALLMFAGRAIQKDIALIRSMDRLR